MYIEKLVRYFNTNYIKKELQLGWSFRYVGHIIPAENANTIN